MNTIINILALLMGLVGLGFWLSIAGMAIGIVSAVFGGGSEILGNAAVVFAITAIIRFGFKYLEIKSAIRK